MRQLFVTFFCLSVIIDILMADDNGCTINPFEVALHPLITTLGTNEFIYPKWGEEMLRFKSGDSIEIICPRRSIFISQSQINQSLLTATCMKESIFKINHTKVDWKELKCNGYPWRTIRYTGNSCAKNGSEIEIGFKINEERFLRFILICFNRNQQIAYYTYINQTASINQRTSRISRPAWLQGPGFYSIGKVTKLYLRSKQKKTINRLLGLPDDSNKYIKDVSNYFLARGHLTPKADGFYAAQQNSTFFMPNIAPQWQTFNGFIWNRIEADVRDYAEAHGVDLQIWTGVHGISTLPHAETGEDVELYLFVNATLKALPVPEIFWKVVFNPVSEEGVALIGINNPYISIITHICKDISNTLKWLHCKSKFCYACSIPSFRKVSPVLPYFNVKGLLL